MIGLSGKELDLTDIVKLHGKDNLMEDWLWIP